MLVEHPTREHHEISRAGGVVLVPYDSEWPRRYEDAARAILEACPGVVTEIHHIGSTSIPGLAAKPYIDIMPGLARFEDGERMVEPMARLGYAYKGEGGIPGRHYFSRRFDDDPHAWKHNVHAYAVGYAEWDRHLVFRDALRADSELAHQYLELKLQLAARFPNDVEAYANAKSDFVEAVIADHGGPPRPRGYSLAIDARTDVPGQPG